MSYDISIWSIEPAKIPESLPEKEKWLLDKNSAYLSKKEWQIVVNNSDLVESEDISEEIQPTLPGIRYRTDINLEPISAPSIAKTLLEKISRAIAKDSIGVIFDQQEDTLTAPSGVKRFVPVPKKSKERVLLLEMSWWFNDNPLTKEEILSKLIDYFEKNLPEVLPRRYGLYEPPQFKYQEQGKEHFKKFLFENLYDFIVWYTTRPVLYLHFGFLKQWGFITQGRRQRFRSNHLKIEVDANVLNQPGWEFQLKKVFKDISIILNPFYGEVRFLSDYFYMHGVTASNSQSQPNPTLSWWWRGIPHNLGQMIVVGEPYLKYWPKLKEKAEKVNSLYFISTPKWSYLENVNKIIGKVPKDIAMVKEEKEKIQFTKFKNNTSKGEYPKIFPFRIVEK